MSVIKCGGSTYKLRPLALGDVFKIKRKLNELPSEHDKQLSKYREQGLLTDPIPKPVLDHLAELRQQDKKRDTNFLSEFYIEWLLSVDGMTHLVGLLTQDDVEFTEEQQLEICNDADNISAVLEMIMKFKVNKNDTFIDKQADKVAGSKKNVKKKVSSRRKTKRKASR